ncbi:hypothetical protein [Levilactobacillus phage ENFP1]|nr:hypothetical protein [Levilactobacillus phage ENFP1]
MTRNFVVTKKELLELSARISFKNYRVSTTHDEYIITPDTSEDYDNLIRCIYAIKKEKKKDYLSYLGMFLLFILTILILE